MSQRSMRSAQRRGFLVRTTAFVAASLVPGTMGTTFAQTRPPVSRPEELKHLEERASRTGIRGALGSRVATETDVADTYSELMPRLVDLIDRASASGGDGQDIARAASELLSRVHRSETGEHPTDEYSRRAPPAFQDLQKKYREQFESCVAKLPHKAKLDAHVQILLRFRHRYEGVATRLNIPWYFVGLIHALEASFNFGAHLHNGDHPLSRRTVRVPANRPAVWAPPIDWESSADDALRYKGYDDEKDWSVERMLFMWEKYNGFGYHYRGVPTPYLWSFSNHYSKGKFVSDGQWDPDYVSQQCGAAVMLKVLVADNIISVQ